jgi:threonine/homoserine/homoserine lactone efflux protein
MIAAIQVCSKSIPLSHPEAWHEARFSAPRLDLGVDGWPVFGYASDEHRMDSYLAFILASIVLTATPGPDNVAILSLGLAHGRRAGMGFALGCALGCLTHTVWAALGVSALVAASDVAFAILKYAGAAYLLYLGVNALRSREAAIASAEPATTSHFLLRGFIANAINPKVALFFFAFLPQFVNPSGRVGLQMLVLGLTFATLTVILFVPLGFFSGQVGTWLSARPGVARWMNRLTGALFIALAIRLALATRT